MINTQLKLDSVRCGMDFDSTFSKTLNILELHYENPNAQPVSDISSLLKCYDLEVLQMPQKSR